MKKKRQQWATRRRGTPSQVGTKFPIFSRTPMQVKTFKENLRKLRPVRKDSPFQASNPLFEEEKVPEEEAQIAESEYMHETGSTTKQTVSPTELYNRVKDTVNGLLYKLNLRKRPKPQLEEIEIEEEVD